jgi:hypothetical protein
MMTLRVVRILLACSAQIAMQEAVSYTSVSLLLPLQLLQRGALQSSLKSVNAKLAALVPSQLHHAAYSIVVTILLNA